MRSFFAALILFACFAPDTNANDQSRPNFILFIADDISWNDFGCYGQTSARTPNIDKLAARGLRFDQAFLTASSCSPSRSSIITGRYPHNNGKAAELHQPISANLDWFPAIMREAGYYTVLSGKNHMQVGPLPDSASRSKYTDPWHHTSSGNEKGNAGGHAHWVKELQDRPQDQPFFFWFASTDAHRDWDADKDWVPDRYGPKHDPATVYVPPFLVDTPETRQDMASYYNEVTRFDYFIGQVVKELQQQGVLDNTLLLVMADNGRPFPRAKTRLHDSGMKTPLVAHWPGGIPINGATDSLISAIDIAPTVLQAAGLKPTESMQGISFLPILNNPKATTRKFAFSEHNWHDYEAHGRSIRDKDFLLIKNFRPQQAWQGPADSVRSPSHQDLLAKQKEDDKRLTPAQADVLLAPRPDIEMYRTSTDPHQLNNLAGQPEYASIQRRLTETLARWMEETHDSVPENISTDQFDRQTGDRTVNTNAFRGTTPGEDRQADQSHAPGPR
jgi:arylsulfatase A-like enzyme